ncbi:mannose-6-phosphate isomerase type 1 [Balneicella halophila]|uniref:Phosphohexomutase n=1 Tax=Balneicella halophila TaxID=1537566 RepID=A0A7L4UR53_BALHA|nr:type I phosphomannose isomerase catalytic subunit [Balneicella halophila]PVX52246.1 mannose-6-phosphate isomerase type 1 [Balneicella halophila]
MNKLYPLKFSPIFKEKIWGGEKLRNLLNKDVEGNNIGESWEISGVQDNVSVVSNGFLAGNNIEELVEVYMGDLVGDSVYEKFGIEFPLLVKFIDAKERLSLQVHPNDEMARERHHSYGKTEVWYITQADKGAELISGFNRPISREEYLQLMRDGKIEEIINKETVKEGDCLYMPSGRIHSIGAGVLLAEIQQTSDITYRIFDWNRVDAEGNKRELHTDLALDAIDFSFHKDYMTRYDALKNKATTLVQCPYFTTNLIYFSDEMSQDFHQLDSFVIYMCVDGKLSLLWEEGEISLIKGETVLVPASIDEVTLEPDGESKVLEIYIS